MTLVLDANKPEEIQRAASLIEQGELVAFPTETVYGLGASAFNLEAMAQIFRVKGRPSDNPLIVHIHSLEQVEQLACQIPACFYTLVERFWPGPLTCVLKRRSDALCAAGLETIAIRMPNHRVALELIRLSKVPLVAPSANLSGKPSATRPEHVLSDFQGKIAALLDDGPTTLGIESTVLYLCGKTPLLLRPGSLALELLEETLGCPIVSATTPQEGPLHSPGMKYRHYAPACPVKLFETEEELTEYALKSEAKRMVLSRRRLDVEESYILCAQELYALLRQADRDHYQEVLVLCDPELRAHRGLMNRLAKASGLI